MRRRLLAAACALGVLLATVQIVAVVVHAAGDDDATGAGLASVPALLQPPAPAERTVDVYAGAGAWVDRFDVGQADGTVTPADVDAMADAGVRTLYLQAAADEPGRAPGLTDPGLIARFLVRAHQRGLRVVGWYLPRFGDVERDLDHLRAIAEFDVLGHSFDGVAVDIEWRDTVADASERSARLVELSEGLRDAAGGDALGAIVLAPVHLDVVNPGFWPGFPWDELAPLYDAWLPMGYWTERSAASGYRDAATYTTENLRRLRAQVGDDAPVHAIGGLGEDTGEHDLDRFVAAAEAEGAIGASIYDWATFPVASQRLLSGALDG
jgi:hypothetical protein